MITKPMLAQTCEDISALKFPVLATPKLDGIRCLVVDGKAVSRKFKPIPNHFVRNKIEALCPNGFDGEIMCPGKTFNETQSLIMTEEGEPVFQYWIFDYVKDGLKIGYSERMKDLNDRKNRMGSNVNLVFLFPVRFNNWVDLTLYEHDQIIYGYEGVMVRTPDSPYKCGRSTLKEGYLLKIKRFADAEATVIGFEERLKNNNELQTNELGYAKRSSHKANLEPANTLGNLLVKDINTGVEFGIGTGFDDITRKDIWDNRDKNLGKIVSYQYQPSGMKDKPRFPSFRGFRDERDM